MIKNYIIYCHTNLNNNKSYIGLTSFSIEKRWKQHIGLAQRGSKSYFHKTIRKYGTNVWKHEILETLHDFENAKLAEQFWIKEKNTYCGEANNVGYNETKGGEGTFGLKRTEEQKKLLSKKAIERISLNPELRLKLGNGTRGKKHTEFHNKKISQSLCGKKHTKETKQKISEGNKGKVLSQETKEKLSKAKLGKTIPLENRINFGKHSCRKIYQLDKNGEFINEFNSIVEAEKLTGVTSTHITRCCRGKRPTAGGFTWRYC